MGLYQDYRPQSLKWFFGNEDLKRDLRPFIKGTRAIPRAILFTGPSGCGKTTLARILAKNMNCAEQDITELDTADFRGIDSIRDIRRQMGLASLNGQNRVWILDECFAAHTSILTPHGPIFIEDIESGQDVYSANGRDFVVKKYVNKVSLDRVCRLTFDNGTPLVSTIEHAFFTLRGWIPARNLRLGDIVFIGDFHAKSPGDIEDLWQAVYSYATQGEIIRREFDSEAHFAKYIRLLQHVFYSGGGQAQTFLNSFLMQNLMALDKASLVSSDEEKLGVARLASFTLFKPSYLGSPEWQAISDKDIARGYTEFFDLEISQHHSYFANGVLVHNCHKLTNDAQNALLKALENPPSHVYFILCTTDPQLLLKTVLTRCTQFTVEALSTNELIDVLARICDGEEADIPDDILKNIAKNAQGSPRAAISMLERVLARSPEDYDKEISVFSSFETQIKDLCQILLQGKAKWKDIAAIIKGISEEPESTRRAILGYMNSVLLSGKDSARAAYILECFKEPYYNSGPAGLTLSCYAASLSNE